MNSSSSYRAPWWLPGGHLQTLYGAAFGNSRVDWKRARWDTPDGDFIDVDRLPGAAEAPLVVLFHGLEGGSSSHYAVALARELARRGWRGAVPHFRGCSGEPNRLPRAYHSGDAEEISWILRRLRGEARGAPLFAMGVSLGGNALLKWLGEDGEAKGVVVAAAAVSAPVDLMAAGDALGRGFNLVYTRAFLATMKKKGKSKLEHFPGLFDGEAMRRARTLRDFDEVVTAPLHGFRDTDDYWTRASAKPVLGRIAVPTLLLNARNDPFLPEAALPGRDEVSPAVCLEFPDEGGHASFVSAPFPGNLDWMPQRVAAFFQEAMARREARAATYSNGTISNQGAVPP
ncbi:MAG TPA: alpha/beta fold hydrolase [Burkholderiales bacterium]